MKKTIVLLLLLSTILTSCSKDKVFEKYIKIENNKWKRDNIITFNVDIKDAKPNYDITLALRHTPYYSFANIKVNVTLTFPSGDIRTRDFNIFLRNPDGSFKGDVAGDLWDINYPVFNEITFPDPGIYKIEVQNIMPIVELPDIMDVGMIVRKSKNKE
jgi:gliding motility-associated lipoprotein GldH